MNMNSFALRFKSSKKSYYCFTVKARNDIEGGSSLTESQTKIPRLQRSAITLGKQKVIAKTNMGMEMSDRTFATPPITMKNANYWNAKSLQTNTSAGTFRSHK